MQKLPISVILPVFNEEKHIEDCLKSVLWADEIIVVDGGSTDDTPEIAERYTGNVLITDNAPAETQRMKTLQKARNNWVFFIDADERVSAELATQIEAVIDSTNPDAAYKVLRLNLYKGKPVHMHHPDYQMRLFQTDKINSLPDRIHRVPKIDGKVGSLSGGLDHLFFSTVHEYLRKLNFYTSIEAGYRNEAVQKVSRVKLIGALFLRPPARFLQYYFLKKGFLDGFFGFFYSVCSAFYEWAVSARLLIDPVEKSDSSDLK